MTALLLAVLAGAGVHLLSTARGQRGRAGQGAGPGSADSTVARISAALRRRSSDWLAQAGLAGLKASEFLAVSAALALVGGATAFALFGGVVPAIVIGAVAAAVPLHLYRGRRAARLAQAQEAWPRLIEEVRVHALTLGRSIPQALIEVGRRAPLELRPAFEAAERDWLLSFDFARTLDGLRARLADPTADMICETLLVAHEVGGTDLGNRLEALAADRLQDAEGRKDAQAKQAGVRFARRFVLVVPAGMAAAGAMIGGGRAAYASPTGQVVVLVALALVGACWFWAGRYLRLPATARVFLPAHAPEASPTASAGHATDDSGRLGGRAEQRLAGQRPAGRVVGRPVDGDAMSRLLALCLVGLWCGATLLFAQLRWSRRPSLQQRLARFAPRRSPLPERDGGLLSVESFREVIGPLARSAGERLTRLLGVAEPLELRLRRLGSTIDPTTFRLRQLTRGAAAAAIVLAASVAMGAPPIAALGLAAAAPLIVFLVMEQRLISAGERRRQQLRDELPVVTEQLGMLLAAGFSLGSALARVASRSSGVCGHDLRDVGNRVRQGLSEVEALREWADLADVDELRRLVTVLQLQQEAGDLGRLISEEARSMRREAQRRLVETIERRAQLVWIPVTVATLLPGVLLMAVPFLGAMKTWSAL